MNLRKWLIIPVKNGIFRIDGVGTSFGLYTAIAKKYNLQKWCKFLTLKVLLDVLKMADWWCVRQMEGLINYSARQGIYFVNERDCWEVMLNLWILIIMRGDIQIHTERPEVILLNGKVYVK